MVSNENQVNHPSHYTQYDGLEIIDLTEQMNFNRGNVVKYVARAGFKSAATEIQDLEKARFYIDREIRRVRNRTKPDSEPHDDGTMSKVYKALAHESLGLCSEQIHSAISAMQDEGILFRERQ